MPPDTPATAGHPQPRSPGTSGATQPPIPPLSLPRAPLPPHPVVLIGSHGGEARLLEDEGFEVLLRVFLAVFPGVHVDHVKTRLVSVHGVQNDLNDKTSKETITDPGGAWREESAAPGPARSPARGSRGAGAGAGSGAPGERRGQGHPTGITARGAPPVQPRV